MKHLFQFVWAALRSPMKFGTVLPASRHLADFMVSHADLSTNDVVVELGPGSGPITSAIQRHLANHANYIGIELSAEMISILQTRFPRLLFVQDSAENIQIHLPEGRRAQYIFSSLPWALFPPEMQFKIFSEIHSALKDEGMFIAYGYTNGLLSATSQHFQNLMEQNFSEVVHTKTVWLNFPPATIFLCRGVKTKQPVGARLS